MGWSERRVDGALEDERSSSFRHVLVHLILGFKRLQTLKRKTEGGRGEGEKETRVSGHGKFPRKAWSRLGLTLCMEPDQVDSTLEN